MADGEMVFMFFTTGKSSEDVPPDELMAMQKRHIENLERLYHAGLSPLAGPLADPDKKRRGIVLLNLQETEAVSEHFQQDPYATQGFMQIEAHKVRIRIQVLDEPSRTEITEHRIALLESVSPLNQPVVHDIALHLEELPYSERPRLLAVREKDTDSLAIIALFLASDDASIRKTLRAVSPDSVHDTDWKIWRQWCSKGVLKS